MPDVRMPNGTVIRNVPAGVSKADLLKKLERNGMNTAELLVPPQKENTLEKVPLVGDLLAGVADLPLEFTAGLAGTSKTVTDAFGADNAASEFLDNISKGALGMRSSEARRDSLINAIDQQQAEQGGAWEEIKAAGRSFVRSPLDTTANLTGSALPFIGAGVAGAALAPATGGASLIPAASMLGLGAVSGAGLIKGEVYDAVYEATFEAAVESGIDEQTAETKAEEAAERAQEYGGENIDQIGLGAALGAAASATGFSRQIANTIGQRAAQRVAQRAAARAAGTKAPGAVRGFVTGAVEEAVPEAIQAGQERYARNVAQQREGFDVDTWRGVAGQAAFEGIASLVLGGYGGARSARAERKLLDDTADEFNAITPDADEKTLSAATQRFVNRGFNQETAENIVRNMQAQKAAIDEQAAKLEQQRQERTVGAEPSVEPNINAPGMVREEQEFAAPPEDPEVVAERMRAYGAQMGGAPVAEPAPVVEPAPSVIPPVEEVSPRAKFNQQMDTAAVRSTLDMYNKLTSAGQVPPPQLVQLLARKVLDIQGTPVMDEIAASDLGPAVQQFFANEAASINEVASQKAAAGVRPNIPQPMSMTPERAGMILNDPVALSDYEAAGGDINELYDIADGVTPDRGSRVFPQRGRRPIDTATPDMFAGAPLQEAPGIEAKREELSAQRFATDEERLARQEQAAAEFEAGTERAAALRQREEADREETLGDIEYALRAQAPENAVYKVAYDPEDANPYKLVAETKLGKKPEEVLKAKTLQDFSDQVYGRMMELTPYIPEAPAAIQEIEERESDEQKYPTVATRMIQEFTAEVDAAREAGQIDNLQRSELLGRLQRPNAYRLSPNGERMIPNDAIAKLEKEAIDAASAANNATAEERDAATAAAVEANDRLAAAVKNSLLNPARAKLKSMVEMRQDEKVGARVRQKEAEAEGDTREARDAKIDLAQLKVTKRPQKGEVARVDTRAPRQVEAEIEGKDIEDVVDWLVYTAPNKAFAAIARAVGTALARQRRLGWTTDIQIVRGSSDAPSDVVKLLGSDVAGVMSYNPQTRTSTVYLNPASRGSASGMRYETILHELIHAAISPYLDFALEPKLQGTRVARLGEGLRGVLDAIREHAKGADVPALENEHELLAWALSNQSVMEYLNTVPYKGKQTIFDRFIEVVRNILGLSAKSDSALAEVLRIGEELLYIGDREAGALLSGDPNFNPVMRLQKTKSHTPAQKKRKAAVEGLSTGARRVKDTISVYGMEDGIGEATGANSKVRDALTYADDMSSPMRIAALKGMPTSGVLNWLKRKASAEIHSLARTVADTVSKMGALRASLAQAAETIERGMDDFTRKFGSGALAELRFTARINGVDPFAFDTGEAALKADTVLKPIEDALLKNSNNKAETRKLIDEIKAQVTKPSDNTKVFKDDVKLSTPVRTKLNALTKLAIDNSKVTLKVEQLAARTQEIRDTYLAKEALSKQKGGLALYKAEREYHKDMFDARVAMLDERATDSLNPEQAKKVREVRAEIMREVQSPEERKKGGDLFYDIDPELFAKDYFPMVRDGDYWLRVSEDAKTQREEALYVFKSARELGRAQRQLAKQLGVDPNDRKVLTSGSRLADLQNTIKSEDELMKRVFDIVDKAKAQYQQTRDVDMRELVDAIYQTYLMTTPERSARRRFMHAKEITGFSLNVYDNFRKQVATNANELTKLAYAGKVRADVEGLKAAINSPERAGSEAVMLNDFARELETRAEQEINPPPPGALNAFVTAMNRVSFLYFLTSAKTALTNFANLPIRVVPRFWRDYGYTEGTAMWLKYMKMWKSLGRVKIERTNMRFGDYLDAIMPNVNGSSFVKNNADLQWAMRAGTERGILMTTTDTITQSERTNPLRQQTGAVRTAQDATANLLKSMTFLFTGTENISRQATFYMAFELELKKFRKENRPNNGENLEAFTDRARQQALRKAVEIVDDTIGNFANWERPSLTKGELARGFFLFKMHPILQTKFMVGAFRDIVAAPLRGAARQATGRGKLTKEDTAEVAGALKELSGVLMMGGLMGGLAIAPFYTMMVEALAYAFEPDPDDDDDVNKLMREDAANAYDADIAFRRWLSEYLGVDESGESQLANIIIDGPVGVLTDTEMSSTVSLDLVKLWYREPIAGDNLESTAIAALIANVAGLSTASQILRGFDEFEDGNIRDGLKKVSPAFFRSWINAYYNSTEGVKNRKDDTIIPKEKITASDTFQSALGARSLRLAKWQDYSITALKNEDRIGKERQEIFDEIEQMRNNGEFATMDDFRTYWNEVVVPFNRTYPNERFIITEESVKRSLRGRDERSSRTVDGRQINKKDAERILSSQEMFRPK